MLQKEKHRNCEKRIGFPINTRGEAVLKSEEKDSFWGKFVRGGGGLILPDKKKSPIGGKGGFRKATQVRKKKLFFRGEPIHYHHNYQGGKIIVQSERGGKDSVFKSLLQ